MRFAVYPKYKPSGIEWLGDVPEHWGVKRLKMAAALIDRKVEADEENPVPYIGMENIESWTGRLLNINLDFSPTGTANEFKAGNTLFGKLRPYLAKACNPEFDGLCSTELLVLRSADLDRRALLYSLLADGFIKLVDSSTYGSKMPRASWEFIGACEIPVAPHDEQRTIADFLDRETAKLDALVAKKRTLIERLKEKRTALISRTVTRGLPPDAARAAGLDPHPKLMPSGIDWLGDVPEHWSVARVSHRFRNLDSRRIPLAGEVRSSLEKIYPYYGASGIIDHVDEYIFDETLILVAEDGANLLSRSTPLAFIASGQYWVNNHAHILKPIDGDIRYWVGVLQTFDFTPLITGAAQPKLTSDRLGSVAIPNPPPLEQTAIGDFLDCETTKIDAMVAKIDAAIECLQEYRTALITAAVTGKIDVRRETNGD
jgi:type I restriction enzyme S subunit